MYVYDSWCSNLMYKCYSTGPWSLNWGYSQRDWARSVLGRGSGTWGCTGPGSTPGAPWAPRPTSSCRGSTWHTTPRGRPPTSAPWKVSGTVGRKSWRRLRNYRTKPAARCFVDYDRLSAPAAWRHGPRPRPLGPPFAPARACLRPVDPWPCVHYSIGPFTPALTDRREAIAMQSITLRLKAQPVGEFRKLGYLTGCFLTANKYKLSPYV